MDRPGRISRLATAVTGSRSVERSLFLFVLGLVLAGFAAALWATSEDSFRDEVAEDVPGMEDTTANADAIIGPEPGTALDTYVADRVSALAAADGRRVAIVSFTDYLTEEEADGLVADTEVGVLLVAFPAGDPTATADLATLRSDLVAEAEEQLPELKAILPTVDDEEFADFYASEIDRYERVLAAGTTPRVVFGAIVRSDADVLRSLADDERVRLVDVGDSDAVTHGAFLAGLRPEESTIAGEPAVRPAESGS